MKIDLLLVSLTIAVLTVAGCQHDASKNSAAPAANVQLQNVDWRPVTLGGKPIVKPLDNDKPPILRLDAESKRVNGYSGLNQFSGTYQLDGQKLKFGPLAMTRRAGPAELMEQESKFGEALDKTASWRAAGGGMELLDSSNSVLATFAATGSGPSKPGN